MHKRLPGFSTVRLVVVITAVVAMYFVAEGALDAVRARQLGDEESRLEAEIADLQGRHERLTALEGYLNSDEYIETVAREQLGLVKPGEIGFVAISTQPTPTPAPSAGPELWWEVLIR